MKKYSAAELKELDRETKATKQLAQILERKRSDKNAASRSTLKTGWTRKESLTAEIERRLAQRIEVTEEVFTIRWSGA